MSEIEEKLQINRVHKQNSNETALGNEVVQIKKNIDGLEQNISDLENRRELKLGELAEYGFGIMTKDSANDVWRGEVDEALKLTKVGCGAYYWEGIGNEAQLWFKPCYERYDIKVERGEPIGRPDMRDAAWGKDEDNNIYIYRNIFKPIYKDGSTIDRSVRITPAE